MSGGVTFDRLVNADAEPQNWLMYWGNFRGTHYSGLPIDAARLVSLLGLALSFFVFERTLVLGFRWLTVSSNSASDKGPLAGSWLITASPLARPGCSTPCWKPKCAACAAGLCANKVANDEQRVMGDEVI